LTGKTTIGFLTFNFVTNKYAFTDYGKTAITNSDAFLTNWQESHSKFLQWHPLSAAEDSGNHKQHSFSSSAAKKSGASLSADLPHEGEHIDFLKKLTNKSRTAR